MKKSLALIGLFGTSNDALELEVKECLAYYASLISVMVKVFKLVLLRCGFRPIIRNFLRASPIRGWPSKIILGHP